MSDRNPASARASSTAIVISVCISPWPLKRTSIFVGCTFGSTSSGATSRCSAHSGCFPAGRSIPYASETAWLRLLLRTKRLFTKKSWYCFVARSSFGPEM